MVRLPRTVERLLDAVAGSCRLHPVVVTRLDDACGRLRRGDVAAVLVGEGAENAGSGVARGRDRALAACRELRAVRADVPLIAVTTAVQEDELIGSLELGADDCLRLPLAPDEIAARLMATLRRFHASRPAPARAIVAGGLALDPKTRRAHRAGRVVTLTGTEFELLAALAAQPGRTLSRERLLNDLCGFEYEIDSRVIDVHVRNLRCKVEAEPSAPALIRSVPGVGYCFGGQERSEERSEDRSEDR